MGTLRSIPVPLAMWRKTICIGKIAPIFISETELAIHVINAFQARDKSQKRPLAQIEVEHADAPPIRKKSASKKRARAAAIDPSSSYEWWSDFIHACGLPQDAPPDSLLPPVTFNDDSAKEWIVIVYLSSVLTSLGPRREAFLIQRARSLDDVWSAVSSDIVSPSCRLAQPETRVGPDVSLPAPSSEVANSPHDGAGIPFDDLIRMMEEPLPLTNQGALQDITAAVEPTAAETTPFLFVEGNPLSALSSIALGEERNEPLTASHSVLDPSMPPEETGILVEPSSQPAGPAAAGQGDASPIPDPDETNNTEGGLFVPLPPASDLPVAAREALGVLEARLAALRSEVVGTAGQISMVRDQHTSLLSTQREKSARASLLHMLASCLDRSVAEDTQHSVALAARLLSLEAEQSKIHTTIAALEAEVDLLRASATGGIKDFPKSHEVLDAIRN
ncbi:hypothetical protein Taro_055518 [Colocasia esculenta]|uniref:Uncharacterized protein n=1 Tax=Colocasia esculenta TaxID=4460 RepID=A0A843XT70_COLES|nr:hypothetical protein [Colocasia esculenta]